MSDAFGRRLRAYRKLKRWTQVRLADEIGVSVAIIGSLERGTRHPTEDVLDSLMRALDVTAQDLLVDAQPRESARDPLDGIR